MVEARSRTLPPKVALEGKHRILDTLGAMVSGAHLKPGEMAIKYIRAQGGVPEASILTTDIKTSAVNAAMANAMLAGLRGIGLGIDTFGDSTGPLDLNAVTV